MFQLLGRCLELRATIGFWNTLKLYLGHRFARHYTLHLPFLKGPVQLRGRTSDANVFRKVFIAEEYHVPNIDPQLIVDGSRQIRRRDPTAHESSGARVCEVDQQRAFVVHLRRAVAAPLAVTKVLSTGS